MRTAFTDASIRLLWQVYHKACFSTFLRKTSNNARLLSVAMFDGIITTSLEVWKSLEKFEQKFNLRPTLNIAYI